MTPMIKPILMDREFTGETSARSTDKPIRLIRPRGGKAGEGLRNSRNGLCRGFPEKFSSGFGRVGRRIRTGRRRLEPEAEGAGGGGDRALRGQGSR